MLYHLLGYGVLPPAGSRSEVLIPVRGPNGEPSDASPGGKIPRYFWHFPLKWWKLSRMFEITALAWYDNPVTIKCEHRTAVVLTVSFACMIYVTSLTVYKLFSKHFSIFKIFRTLFGLAFWSWFLFLISIGRTVAPSAGNNNAKIYKMIH